MKNLPIIGAVIGLFGGLPDVWGNAIQQHAIHTPMPDLLYVACKFSLPLGIGIVGIALHQKGQQP